MTRDDIMAVEDIFRQNLVSLKRETTRMVSPAAIVTLVGIPPEVQDRYINMNLSLYIMFENKVSYVITISRILKFMTAKFIPNSMQELILVAMNKIKIVYSHSGFCIKSFNADNKFEPLRDVIT